ncbi:hypothetical protein [Sulfurivirga sp.]|uniref:hypothetical protein n=1 Tax=Sulfurivirga sp. TaxID=2614236 RepID=UPI0025D790D4|nr:hypothetical protein [Sulfurivirga sp.]
MNPEHIRERIADLEARGRVDAAARARIKRDLEVRNWADLEVFLNQLEIEARFRSWRPIIRLAMLSSLISAAILIAVAVWVGARHPEIVQHLQGQQHGQGDTPAGD